MQITILGTSGSAPTKERNLPSVALEYEGTIWLFDCGEGTQKQLIEYKISPNKIKAIFLTHIHGDHVIGIAGLVRTMALNKRKDPLDIYIPKGEEKGIESLIKFDRSQIGYEIKIKGIIPGSLIINKDFEIKAFRLDHGIPTLGYFFEEKEKVRFIKGKINDYKIKGEMFKEIINKGYIKINKKKITLKELSYKEKGPKFVYVTDTRPTNNIVINSKNADLLIHEGTFSEEHKDLASERKHSTVVEAAKEAKRAKVNSLLITHISARYKDTNALLAEARKYFKNTKIAKDGMKIIIRRSKDGPVVEW